MIQMNFTCRLKEQIDRVPGRNMLFLLGDFNAQVGRNRDRWYPSLGKFGVGKENSNGYRLLQFCRYKNLVIANMVLIIKLPLNWHGIHLILRQQTLLIMLLLKTSRINTRYKGIKECGY